MTVGFAKTLFESLAETISERRYCAGWMCGLEDRLRKVVEAGESPTPHDLRYGQDEVTLEEAAALREIAAVYKWWEEGE